MSIFHLVLVLSTFFLCSCGSQESLVSSGSNDSHHTPGTGPEQPSSPPELNVYRSAALIWGDLENYQAEFKLNGDAEHFVDSVRFSQTQMSFNGVIKSNTQSRDIVLVVDVSGSTQDSDPTRKNDGKCARYDAVKSVINLAKAQSDARFAVVTFDSNVVRRTPGFFPDLEQMFIGELPENILCRHGLATNYKSALESAADIFTSYAIADHLKELYFLTDGAPTYVSGNSAYSCNFEVFCSGIPQAQGLKAQGVVLGTVMLGGTQSGSDYLRDYIASSGPDNLKLHVQAENSSQLVEKLTKLAADNLVGGRIYYRDIGSSMWMNMDMLPITQTGVFQSSPIIFDSNHFPSGLEVQIRYTTSRGFNHAAYAFLRWQ